MILSFHLGNSELLFKFIAFDQSLNMLQYAMSHKTPLASRFKDCCLLCSISDGGDSFSYAVSNRICFKMSFSLCCLDILVSDRDPA